MLSSSHLFPFFLFPGRPQIFGLSDGLPRSWEKILGCDTTLGRWKGARKGLKGKHGNETKRLSRPDAPKQGKGIGDQRAREEGREARYGR